MARSRSCLTFLSRIDHLRRTLRLPCDKCRINFRHYGLFCTKSTADTRFLHTHLGLWNVQCVGNDTAAMEYDLCRTDDMESSVTVNLRVCAESLHHCLLAGFYMICVLHDLITGCKYSIYISVRIFLTGTEISLIVRTHRAQRFPVVLRMHQNLVILGCPEIQKRLQYLISNFYHLKRPIHCFFCLTGHNSNRISYKSDTSVQKQAVIRRRLRISLSCHRKTLLRDILVCVDCHNTGHFHGNICLNLFNQRMCMGTS